LELFLSFNCGLLHQVLPEFQKDNNEKALLATAMLEHSQLDCGPNSTGVAAFESELGLMYSLADGIEMQVALGLPQPAG